MWKNHFSSSLRGHPRQRMVLLLSEAWSLQGLFTTPRFRALKRLFSCFHLCDCFETKQKVHRHVQMFIDEMSNFIIIFIISLDDFLSPDNGENFIGSDEQSPSGLQQLISDLIILFKFLTFPLQNFSFQSFSVKWIKKLFYFAFSKISSLSWHRKRENFSSNFLHIFSRYFCRSI